MKIHWIIFMASFLFNSEFKTSKVRLGRWIKAYLGGICPFVNINKNYRHVKS